jgi:hypothetical protein
MPPLRASPRLFVPLVAVALAAACSDDPAAPADDPSTAMTTPKLLGVRGQGAVTARYTAELSTLFDTRGSFAYTSTWGRRTGASCAATNCGNVVYVWNVAGATPRVVDSLVTNDVSLTTTTGDVQVSDDGKLLVVATEPTGYLVTYSLADPAHPTLVSRYTTPDLTSGVHTAQLSRVNGKLYAFCSIDPRGTTRAMLVIVDLSNPAAPQQIYARVMGNPYVHDVFVRDGFLFTALWNDGVTIWDIGGRGRGTPAAPDSLGNVRTVNGQVHNIWWYKDASGAQRYAFVGEEGPGQIGASASGDVHVIDVSDPTKPREVAFFGVTGAGTHNFSVDEARGVLYAAYYNAGVRAIDVRGDLSTCTTAQRAPDGRCDLAKMGRELGRALTDRGPVYVWGVEYTNGTLFASDMLNGLWSLDPIVR